MLTLKVVQVGNSLALRFPKEVSNRLKVELGDVVYLTEAPDGGYRITPYDPEFASQMAAAETVMRRRRDALHELAR